MSKEVELLCKIIEEKDKEIEGLKIYIENLKNIIKEYDNK
jgi:hypothetical protein